ncbi:hypothetical protein JCM10908_005753 [Rhodotorula pacifica]|uniref:sterol 3-beta-glucosyltransferase n=1 Tax=Rhodotorula pacifica TaxID=1495444 RepID=UPI00316D75B6
MATVPHEAAQRPGTPPAAVEQQRPSAARSHSAVVGPDADYQRHSDQLANDANHEAQAGRGKGGERFGGMGQAGYRDGQPSDEPPPGGVSPQAGPGEHTSTAGVGKRIVRTPSPTSSISTSSSSSGTSDGVSSDEESRAAAHAVADSDKKYRSASGLIDTEAEMGIGGAGYGKMAVSLDEGEQRRRDKGDQKTKSGKSSKFWSGGSKSYSGGGGMGPGYMRMIHALAKEDEEAERKARRERRKHRHHLRKRREAEEKGKDAEGGDEDGDSADEAKFSAPPEHAATTPTLARTDDCETRDGDAAHELSAAAERKKEHKQQKKQRKADRARDGETDMSKSSLLAIHRPIEQRRRTMSDLHAADEERERTPVDLAKVDEIEREQEKYERKYPGMGSRQNTSTSVASVDTVERREKLSEKLMDVFGLEEPEEVVAEYPCWLFRSILLQGYLYITAGHLCFYAYLAQKEGATIRSGSLSVRGSKTRRYHKHWLILKDSILSWYPSSTDPYFPDGHIDLHYCISVEESTFHKHHFKVATADKRWHFSADSEASRNEWVKAIKKVVFRCQNEGESVKIAIPLETIVDVEQTSSLEFAEMIRVRVYDADEGYSLDEYYLSYFKDLEGALDRINSVLDAFRLHHPQGQGSKGPLPPAAAHEEVEDTTKHTTADIGEIDDYRSHSKQTPEAQDDHELARTPSKSLGARVSSLLGGGKSSKSSSATRTPTSDASSARSVPAPDSELVTTAAPAPQRTGPAWLPPPKAPPIIIPDSAKGPAAAAGTPASGSVATLRPPQAGTAVSGAIGEDVAVEGASPLVAVAGTLPAPVGEQPAMESDGTCPNLAPTLANQPQPSGTAAASDETLAPPPRDPTHAHQAHTYPPGPPPAREADEPHPPARGSTLSKIFSGPASGGRKILETVTISSLPGRKKRKDAAASENALVEEPRDVKEVDEFRKTFGLGDKEELLHDWPAFLFRGLPISGHAYISDNYFCFRSGGLLATRTKMILPINDVIGVSKHRSYRIGYSGLVVVIKGHEEVFLELSSAERRDACMKALEEQRDLVKQRKKEDKDKDNKQDDEHRELRELVNLSATKDTELSSPDMPHPQSEAIASQPPIMFSSTTSDFVTFRPEKPLRFTCLTIGSRGDVQPYIALCKGLMAQGHHCKIASHAEYKKWVEGHGIDFAPVGGDPAELMQLMISHDFFTISFMKEAVSKFRGWLDDLLDSAWEGCQNSDVLIESPSAIAGYHVAEALQIPYYRAFTMPWSRTRAYPHAFAVPEVHMGGGYNYMSYTMFDQVFWRATAGQVNRWRKNTLKVRSTNLEAMQQHKIPFLYNFSPVVVPPPLDWRENIHVTGYWWLDNPDDSKSQKWEPPQELLDWMEEAKSNDKKVVFIGFGSIIIPDPLEMTRVIVESVEKAGVYAIVAKGWSDRQKGDEGEDTEEAKKKREENEEKHKALMDKPFVFQVKSIPHDWLFPRIDAAVHHGGAGTTGASLRAGLPTIIKPFFGDQHFYADRVETLGIGSHITDFKVDDLTAALKMATEDEKQIERACLAGEEIRKEDGVATAIECIYRDLEYARSLVPKPSERGKDGVPLESEPEDDDSDSDDSLSSSDEAIIKEEKPTRANDDDRVDEKLRKHHSLSESSQISSPTANSSTSPSQQNDSRTTSSDEGWDVMSRGSAVESASRASSTTRATTATEGGSTAAGDEDASTGILGRTLGFLGKPIKNTKST